MKKAFITILLSTFSLHSLACECGRIILPNAIDQSELVFIGKMVSAEYDEDSKNIYVEFSVSKIVKGRIFNLFGNTIKLETSNGMCGLKRFDFGSYDYAVFLKKDSKRIGWCNAKSLSPSVDKELINQLNNYK